MTIAPTDQSRIATAIRAVEARTSAELVCVLARASSDYAALPILWSSLGAMLTPWILVLATQISVQRILLVQAAVFCILLLILSWPSIRVRLAPAGLRREQAHRAAMEQFMIRGMSRKKDRTGVLIFVSLAEHYVRIVADDGIAARVDQSEWQNAVDAMLAHLRDGRTGDGFVAAIEHCGKLLERHFPPKPDESADLPDRIFLI